MPNWCDNRMIVSGPEDRIGEFVQLAEGPLHTYKKEKARNEEVNEELLSFHQIVPLPEEVLSGPYDPVGYAGEYEAWGVKWGVRGAEREYEPGEGFVEYRFATAWTPPLEFIRRASKRFPGLAFDLRFEEESVDIFGRCLIQNGIMIREMQWEFDEDEARRLSLAEQTQGVFELDLLPRSELLFIKKMDAFQLHEIGIQIQKRFEVAAAVADKLSGSGWLCSWRDLSQLAFRHREVTTQEAMKKRLSEAGVDWKLRI